VATYATFTQGAKIILAANNYLGYMQSKHSMTILKANTLTIKTATIDNILHSRMYNSNYQELTVTSGAVITNSVLINVTNPKITNNILTADIQQRSFDFDINKKLLTSSLLGNHIISSATITTLRKHYLYKAPKDLTKKVELTNTIGTIYADSDLNSVVKIEVSSTQSTVNIASFTIDCTCDGIHDQPNNPIYPAMPALAVVATTNNKAELVASSLIIGEHALLVGSPAIKIGSITSGEFLINGSLTNKGIIRADSGDKAIQLVGNKKAGASKFKIINQGTIEGNLDCVTDSGNQAMVYIVDNDGLITTTGNDAKFQTLINQNGGEIISYGSITFLQDLTNNGSITQQNINRNFNLGNSSNNTYTVTNTGYIKVAKLIAYNKITNLANAHIELNNKKEAKIHKLDNSGYINCSDEGWIDFYDDATNTSTGKINIPGGIEFIKAPTTTTFTNKGLVTSGGDCYFQNTINEGTIILTNNANFKINLTNSGTIEQTNNDTDFTLGGGSTTHTVVNKTGGYINVGNLTTYNNIINETSGRIDIDKGRFYADITNSGTITIKSIYYMNNNVTFINKANALIKFVHSFSTPNLTIENQSSLLLPAYSEIGSYMGKGSSDLVLTLSDKNIQEPPLLKVTNDASFDPKSKIILAGKLAASTFRQPVTIVDARKITIQGTVTSLLYSQVYNNIPKPSTPTELAPGSIFINIAATTLKTVNQRDLITAIVEFINPLSSSTSLTNANKVIAKSLLNKDILQATNLHTQVDKNKSVALPKEVIAAIHKNIDTSGVEYSQVVNNHLHVSNSLVDNITTIMPANQKYFNLRNLNYNILGSLGYFYGSNNDSTVKHNWKQTLLHIGGESALDKTRFGLSFVYLGCDMSASTKPNSKSNSYLAVVHAITNIAPWSFNAGLIFGTTKYNDSSTKNKSIGQVSAIASSRYEVTVDKFKVNLGLNSALTHVSMSKHINSSYTIDSNSKLFFCLGASAGATTSYNIQNKINITTEINSGYSYTTGIQNENNITLPLNGNYKLSENEIPHHNLKINIKNSCYYKKVHYCLSFNCNYNTKSTLLGGIFAVSYKF
jgi:hypothetical protein